MTNTQITPRLVELTYEAALTAYWRKAALRQFLRSSGVSSSFLATWADDESKRQILDRLCRLLQSSEDGGAVMMRMARSLSEMTSFPDLRNWEDAADKIGRATTAVRELRNHLARQAAQSQANDKAREKRQQAHERRLKIQRSTADRDKLRQELEEMHAQVGTQQGGYAFERWFYRMLDYFEVTSRRPYKAQGRQIDGALTVDGTTYLVETKFTAGQTTPDQIDTLKAKVSAMADNTMGLFVSISGYTAVATQQASGPGTTLLVLDSRHIFHVLAGNATFPEVVSRARRHASQTGQAYWQISP